MAAGHTDDFIVVVAAPSGLPASTPPLVDTATVTTTTTLLPGSVTSSSVTTTVAVSATLSVTKIGPAAITAGTTATYTITLTNLGPSDATTVSLTDALPAGLDLVAALQVAGTDTFNNLSTGNLVQFTTATLVAGHSDTFQVIVHAPSSDAAGTLLTDTATATASDAATVSSTVNSTAATSADLSVVKTGPLQIAAGSTITYTIDAFNAGPSDAQAVTLTDVLPVGLSLISFTAVNTNPDTFAPSGAATVFATTMGAGHTDVFQVVAKAAPGLAVGTTITNTATILSATTPDPNLSNNTSVSTAAVVTAADLAIVKGGPATVTAGTTLTYTLTVMNLGPSDAASVVVKDALPTGETLISESQIGGNDAFVNGSTDNTVMFTATTVAAGNTDTFQIIAATASSLANGSALVNTATVSAATFDPNLANNSSTLTTDVVTTSGLTILKTGPVSGIEGNEVTYTGTVTNSGPSDAQNVTISDVLPGNLSVISATQTGGADTLTFSVSGNTVTGTAATVAAGHADTFQIVAVAIEDGPTVNTATVTTTTNNIPGLPSSSSVTTAIAEAPLILGVTQIDFPEGTAFTADIANFTHANGVEPASAFSATINWGDGTSSTGGISKSGTVYTVSGTHTFNIDTNVIVTVTITEDGVNVSASHASGVFESAPVSGKVQNFVFETLDDAFNQMPSTAQVKDVTGAMMALDLAATGWLTSSKHVSALPAAVIAFFVGEVELSLIAAVEAGHGTDLNSAVSDIVNAFLLQALTEPLGLK
jgi:uncharacterized repeat protein (TIGR01451 family)